MNLRIFVALLAWSLPTLAAESGMRQRILAFLEQRAVQNDLARSIAECVYVLTEELPISAPVTVESISENEFLVLATSPVAAMHGIVATKSHLPYDFIFKSHPGPGRQYTYKIKIRITTTRIVEMLFDGYLQASYIANRGKTEEQRQELEDGFRNGFDWPLRALIRGSIDKGLKTASKTNIIRLERLTFFHEIQDSQNKILAYALQSDRGDDPDGTNEIYSQIGNLRYAETAFSWAFLLCHYWTRGHPKAIPAPEASVIIRLLRSRARHGIDGRMTWQVR